MTGAATPLGEDVGIERPWKMTVDRAFGLSRWEKIRIEAARIAVATTAFRTNGQEMTDATYAYQHIRKIADPIERWIIGADEDAGARDDRLQKLADEVVARVREVVGDRRDFGTRVSNTPGFTDLSTDEGRRSVLADMQFEWLASHLAKRGFLGAASPSRRDLIRAYYTDAFGEELPVCVEDDVWRPFQPDTAPGRSRHDDLAVGPGNAIYRFDSMCQDGEWIEIDTLPGHRIENGKIMWSPGLWPPMESEA